MAVFVLGENMVVQGKDVLKLCLGFVWNVDFVKGGVVNFKILVRYWLFFVLSIKRRVLTVCYVRRNIGWCGAICGVISVAHIS